MMPRVLSGLLQVFLLIAAGALGSRAEDRISDMGRALDYCRQTALERPEGIWEFPADNTVVLIRRIHGPQRRYEMIVVETPDCSLTPGEKIGEMAPSVDAGKFSISLYRSRRDGILTDPGHCLGVFDDRAGTIRVEKRKFKFTPRLYRYLPQFWRILSNFGIENPADKAPEGLVRIYPDSKSKINKPRYL